ncbi:tRNA (uridine(54)-C5)-methyltransferase TrmA [Moritella viscosa]|uniref:tRNA/tmRNA (uracil-C(5))-methyltransferase n=1 Tax=Moritella viscosa TaxID=80854 RepID=A0ABY1HF21_9GAMM|nr:tRNA (uridine(54)-C5)-methyltransferase TrmA [Moritella viscosa]SGY94984.1 tRNA (uracil-5-)-methyltransferase-tRNA(M-5-U54)-methyltransferase [Moritella viscosa]SGZ06801.1 tRNA (uracil-5-)-methyltransferase-tRNA(M-5-U54)-methyltransferase [Moritella viscosa]SHO26972.1 tRNA (uracil-5-)-methyltransferase-tRNA(M-5-U54)-methyltransferase [Moritella viscosa]
MIEMHPDNYQSQLDDKVTRQRETFKKFSPPELEVFDSPAENYRLRAEFRVWHDGDDLDYIMFDKETKQKIKIDYFLPGSKLINEIMPALLAELKKSNLLRFKLFQVDFLSTLSGELLISLLYHRQLTDEWVTEAKALKEKLSERFNINIIGRAKKQKVVLDRGFVVEELNVAGKKLKYKQVENSFTQPNGIVNQKMLEWALDVTKDCSGDLLELYCGNGNFSIALAPNFEKVLATEISKSSVQSAQYNIAENGLDNLTILRLSAEEFTIAINGEREFNRLKDAKVDLTTFNCNTIFVDPPRAGLDADTVKMVQEYDNIVYISCSPETLSDNLEAFSQTHNIDRFALFDQFPYTHHIESGVYLTKKS